MLEGIDHGMLFTIVGKGGEEEDVNEKYRHMVSAI